MSDAITKVLSLVVEMHLSGPATSRNCLFIRFLHFGVIVIFFPIKSILIDTMNNIFLTHTPT